MADQSGARKPPAPVQITVFNQTYKVVATDGGERAARVAHLVDARMREIASHITTHEVSRIAVLAALGIADDLLSLQEARGAQTEAPREAAAAPAEEVAAPRVDDADTRSAETPSPARVSWFESVFDDELGSPQRRAGRMSNEVAGRLQSARQPGEAVPNAERSRAVADDWTPRDVRRRERVMTDQNRHRHDEKAERILRWLQEHRDEFESSGVSENSLAAAVGLSQDEVTEAVDHLENREAVARLPQHGAGAQGFLLEPARGWADICEELGSGAAAGEATT
ncbi:MAG: cell division protein ZapA [Pyrinomonadaceae bacterium]